MFQRTIISRRRTKLKDLHIFFKAEREKQHLDIKLKRPDESFNAPIDDNANQQNDLLFVQQAKGILIQYQY